MARLGFELAGACVLACMGSSVLASPAGDFGGIAICAKLKRMPKGYVPDECNRKAPLRQCYFTLRGDSWPVTYLVENGQILDKYLELKSSAKLIGPYSLRRGDSESVASEKFRTATGLALQRWTDHDEPGTSYLQTEEQDCPGNAYTISLWFKDGSLTAVGVSSLPAI